MQNDKYLIVLSVDSESNPLYTKIAATVYCPEKNNSIYFPDFYKVFPTNAKGDVDWTEELEAQRIIFTRQKYGLESCRERTLSLFSDYLLKDVIEKVNGAPCKILIDESFGNKRVYDATKFYNDSINKTQKRLWMSKYFKEPLKISAKIDNHKLKNHDPILHCHKITAQYKDFVKKII